MLQYRSHVACLAVWMFSLFAARAGAEDGGVAFGTERLGRAYTRALMPALPDPGVPFQAFPVLPWDRTCPGDRPETVYRVCADAAPFGAPVSLAAADDIRVVAGADHILIHNGPLAVRIPASGAWRAAPPAPLLGWSRDDGRTWTGTGVTVGVPLRSAVSTEVESVGSAGVQWRVRYAWGGRGGWTLRARWAAGSDTILVGEEAEEDTDAHWEFRPFGSDAAEAWWRGGGERPGAMAPLDASALPGERQGDGARALAHLSHIGYFNQWQPGWVGFTGSGEGFFGVFAAHGGRWRVRGRVRPSVWTDDARGAHLRFPVRAGRRVYGWVLSDRAASRMAETKARCLLNERKIQWSDLAPDKVAAWRLDPPPPPHAPRLLDGEALRRIGRLAGDGRLREMATAHGEWAWPDGARLAAILLLGRTGEHAAAVERLLDWARSTRRTLAEGGYEGFVIFEGRSAKRVAYEYDWLAGVGALAENDAREIAGALLATAYVYVDPDYVDYADFRPETDGASGIADALRDEMGDAPVPPNFAAEFFGTVGLVAELFPGHPRADAWRAQAEAETRAFLRRWFAPDGTYRESVNYQSHAMAGLGAYFAALRRNGGPDFFRDAVVRAHYDLLCRLSTPPLVPPDPPSGPPRRNDPAARRHPASRYAWGFLRDLRPRYAAHPPNGNAGGYGHPQEPREDLLVAADAYRTEDPALAARLVHVWRAAGAPLFGEQAPLLTLSVLDPDAPSSDEPAVSSVADGLGLISRAVAADGTDRYALFRVGDATHHMDFDQGGVFIVADGRVLLGDHGYYARDSDGRSFHPGATWLHSTVTYADDPNLSSGYTGLERAPRPAVTRTGDDYDYAAVEIVNDNHRRLDVLRYTQLLPAARTRHVRRYLYVKPDRWFVVDDFLETPPGARPTAWLWPTHAPRPGADAIFRCGGPGDDRPVLWGRWLSPTALETVFLGPKGALHGWGVRGRAAESFVCALGVMRGGENAPTVAWDAASRTITVTESDGSTWGAVWPAPDAVDALPVLTPALSGVSRQGP